ncbi:hypothetical protein RFI_32172 [Reticulomyxa filosa]|uniref:Uncharacterized protein n=1 Tax=Reticulomyxa filosa TaxID=46433 RepID=X6LUB2_RETFI|nr:hypothetical protein RFI_32172 [Reticulomyxa filosa]|eukprot:ETO05224.1 hypothetical protein RFI_32172 [Reticulomyxa filosa]
MFQKITIQLFFSYFFILNELQLLFYFEIHQNMHYLSKHDFFGQKNKMSAVYSKTLKKEEKKVKVVTIETGINLQDYCKNEKCLAIKAKITVLILNLVRFHLIPTKYLIAMMNNDIINLVAELQKYLIKVVKSPSLKVSERSLEKSKLDYKDDFNQAFDQFYLIVSEDEKFFDRQSKTHHQFHIIKLYVPNYDIYNIRKHSVIENPKLMHLFYKLIRVWKTKDSSKKEELKYASDETLTKINDVICKWNTKISKFEKSEIEIDDSAQLKITQFTYEQKVKKKVIYVILYVCLDIGLDILLEEKQIITELDIDDSQDETKNMDVDKWQKYFNGDSVTRYVLRKVGDNKYQFLHKSC